MNGTAYQPNNIYDVLEYILIQFMMSCVVDRLYEITFLYTRTHAKLFAEPTRQGNLRVFKLNKDANFY